MAAILWCGACRPNRGVDRTFDKLPKYGDHRIDLKKLYALDVTNISLFAKEANPSLGGKIGFDSRDRLYILDPWAGSISIFDENGRFVRSFGRNGQGPDEFSNPSMLFIKDDRIYVLHALGHQFKILSPDGKYLSSLNVNQENPLRYYAAGEDIYLFSGKTEQTFTQLDFILRRFEGGQFDKEKILLTAPYPPGLRGPNVGSIWPNWLWISSDGSFYFPEDNSHKYSIVKYDRESRPVSLFGRTYDARPYSEKAHERIIADNGKTISQGGMKVPAAPPVIASLFRDQRKNMWIVSGETFEETEDPEFENSVDVFSAKGSWLFSFKSKDVSKNSVYNNGRIFTLRPTDPLTEKQTIEVYEIHY